MGEFRRVGEERKLFFCKQKSIYRPKSAMLRDFPQPERHEESGILFPDGSLGHHATPNNVKVALTDGAIAGPNGLCQPGITSRPVLRAQEEPTMRFPVAAMASALVFGALGQPAHAATYTYSTLTNTASPSDYIVVEGVNASNIAVGVDNTTGTGYLWQNGTGMTKPMVSSLEGINDKGIAVGGIDRQKGGPDIIFYDVAADSYQSEGTTLGNGDLAGLYINLAGVVAGSEFAGRKVVPFIYTTSGETIRLHPPGQDTCFVYGQNASGAVAGTCSISGYVGFLYSNGQYTILSVPGASAETADFVTDSGVVGGSATIGAVTSGYTYANGVYTTYTPSLADFANAAFIVGVLPNGNLVGTYQDSAFHYHGFIYNAKKKKYTELNVPGAVSSAYTGLSSSGSLIGSYQTAPGGASSSFIAICKAKAGCGS